MEINCRQCEKRFVIPKEDLDFYKKLDYEIPPPTLCFVCRHQKRLAFRNEVNLYHRKCDFSGNQIISMYSPDKPYKIYDQHVWWGDKWDPMDYGREFDFKRSFFEQYAELQKEVPRMSLNNINPENSDYCNLAMNNKNCYLAFTADDNEDSCYLRFSDRNFRCFDCTYTYDSVDCYNCIDIEKCNHCLFSHKCLNSSGLFMCYNMIGCHDCIGCANLRNKRYYIFNKPYSRDEYEIEKKKFNFGDHSELIKFRKQYEDFLKNIPRKHLDIVNCENSLGDNLRNCKNAVQCFNCVGLEDCRYLINCYDSKDCYDWDFVGGVGSCLCHEMSSCAYNMVNCHFCSGCWENCSDIYYCELCLRSKNLFGCIALRNKQYCILNKQYSKDEYEVLVSKIIDHMKATGEWGEFFPIELSTFAYNETVAYEYFPIKKSEAELKNWKWFEGEEKSQVNVNKYNIPDNINDVSEDVCENILFCEETGKPYKIVLKELKFYKMMNIPIPRIHFDERYKWRMKLRNPWFLYNRNCSDCGVNIKTTYVPGRPEPVYCEKCYEGMLN